MFDSPVNLGYAPSFNSGTFGSFQLAERLADLSPGTLKHVFFTNSGSEAINTALKMALAYQVARGKATKRMFIARRTVVSQQRESGRHCNLRNRLTYPRLRPLGRCSITCHIRSTSTEMPFRADCRPWVSKKRTNSSD